MAEDINLRSSPKKTTDLFAPPTKEELEGDTSDLFAPPTKEELGGGDTNLFAPPTKEELGEERKEYKPDEYISVEGMSALAKKYGVPEDELRSIAPYYGTKAVPTSLGESLGSGLKAAAGTVGREVAFNIPQFLYKKTQEPNMRAALDELQKIQMEQTPWYSPESLSGIVAPGSIAAKSGAKLSTKMAVGAGVGGVGSLARSREGEEIDALIVDMGIGALFPAAIEGGIWLAGKTRKVANEKVVKWVTESLNGEPGKVARAAREANAPAEQALKKAVVRKEAIKTPEELKQVLGDDEIKRIASLLDPVNPKDPSVSSGVLKDIGDTAEARALYLIGHSRNQLSTIAKKATKSNKLEESIDISGGDDFVARQFDNMRSGHYLAQAITESNLKPKSLSTGIVRKAWMKMADARYVVDAIDTRFNTQLLPTFDKVSANHNAYNHAIAPLMESARDLSTSMNQRAIALKMEPKAYREMIGDAAYRGSLEGLDDEARDHVLKLSAQSERAAQSLESFADDFEGLDLSKVKIQRKLTGPDKLYFPHYTVDPVEYVSRTKRFLQQFDDETLKDLPALAKKYKNPKAVDEISEDLTDEVDEIDEATNALAKKAKDAMAALEGWWGKDIKDLTDLRGALSSLNSFQRSSDFEGALKGRSLFERKDNVPEFLIDKDAANSLVSWTQGMFKYVALRNPLDELRRSAEAIDIAAPSFSTYIKDYVQDLSGGRRGTVADSIQESFNRYKLFASEKAAKANTPWKKQYWTITANTDQILRHASGNLYSFFLGIGGTIDNTLRNIPQTFLMTSPAMAPTSPKGILYSYRKTMGSYAAALKMMQNPKALEEMHRLGQLPNDQAFEAIRHIKDGIVQSGTNTGKVLGSLEAVSKASLVLYRGSDTVTRAATKLSAASVVRDLQRKVPEAIESIYNTPIGYRSLITEAINANDFKKVEQLYTDYLLGKSQLNYNKAAMNEFGRSWGWMFSMFSKWPATTIGDVGSMVDKWSLGLNKERNRELAMLTSKYLMPYIIAQAVQTGVYDDLLDDYPEVSAIFGKDLIKYTPADTPISVVKSLSGGQVPGGKVPWVLDMPLKTGVQVVGAGHKAAIGDMEAAKRELNRAMGSAFESATSLAPGGVLLKASAYWYGQTVEDVPFKLRDVPAYIIDDTVPKKK